MKKLKPKGGRASKQAREHRVLMSLVDLYIESGQPVGSHTLKEALFPDLSSATLRNYFAHLEEEGFLTQQHASGGRIPTQKAYRAYADEFQSFDTASSEDEGELNTLKHRATRGITAYLEEAANQLAQATGTAVFLSAPRFDHDFILHLKLVALDQSRVLCVLVTNFGVIKTEVLQTEEPLSAFSLKRMENYFHWRLTGHDRPDGLTEEEERLAQDFYNEIMVRYIVGYSNFSDEEVFRTGFSQLLQYSDFDDVGALAAGLSLFENPHSMRLLLRECISADHLKFWIGDDLTTYATQHPNCSVIATPYAIGHKTVGAVGILGPCRLPYKRCFACLKLFAKNVEEALTKSVYKYKISYRQPQKQAPLIEKRERILLEDKSYQLGENHD